MRLEDLDLTADVDILLDGLPAELIRRRTIGQRDAIDIAAGLINDIPTVRADAEGEDITAIQQFRLRGGGERDTRAIWRGREHGQC